jgi:hypothetical protein
MDAITREILRILIVVILVCLLTFAAVWVINPELIQTVLTPDEAQTERMELDISEINDRLDVIGANLSNIDRKVEYVDLDDYHNLSALECELEGIKSELRDLEEDISRLNNTSGINGSVGSMNDRAEEIQYRIGEKKDAYYADLLDYGLKGIFAGIVVCICVVTIPYLQYRRGKLYGLIGHGGEKEYARDRFRKFLYVMMLFGFILLGSGLVMVILQIILI